jgi:hypothetical protein
MLIQARRDLLVLAEQMGETRAEVELKESTWPPTYAAGCLVAPGRTFAFFEPLFFGHPLVDRLCFIFAEGAPGSSEFVTTLRQTHNRMVDDGATVSL